MINRRIPSALVTAALMRVAENDSRRVLVTGDEAPPVVIRAREIPVIEVAETPMRLHDNSGDTWRRQGKRRGRHAR